MLYYSKVLRWARYDWRLSGLTSNQSTLLQYFDVGSVIRLPWTLLNLPCLRYALTLVLCSNHSTAPEHNDVLTMCIGVTAAGARSDGSQDDYTQTDSDRVIVHVTSRHTTQNRSSTSATLTIAADVVRCVPRTCSLTSHTHSVERPTLYHNVCRHSLMLAEYPSSSSTDEH